MICEVCPVPVPMLPMRNRFGKPCVVTPRYARGESPQTSASERPPRPWITEAIGGSVAWKPVAQTIASTSCSAPSAVTIECSRISRIGDVSTSTFGWFSAGYQALVMRMRLQPISNDGRSLARSAGSSIERRR